VFKPHQLSNSDGPVLEVKQNCGKREGFGAALGAALPHCFLTGFSRTASEIAKEQIRIELRNIAKPDCPGLMFF